jgi:redox-sensitive bicupin YhaK (pirin superfamily)
MTERSIQEIRSAHPSRDGDGVAIQRIAGMRHPGMDPILMIDELRSERREDFVGGFPPHPHRGMQTLTYMKHGGIVHEDSRGNRGEIRGGGAQWMSAGRGIIHSEMPTQDSAGLHGFQLWVNLSRREKMSEPRYRDIPAAELARATGPGFEATAVAGQWQFGDTRLQGPLRELEERAGVADVALEAGAAVTVATGSSENVLAYVYEGSLAHGGVETGPRHLVVTGPGDSLTLRAGHSGARLLLLRGNPLGEPVAHYGPFVMNTPEEIDQAVRDYQSGHFG